MRYISFLFVFALFISGCSSKQYFEPENSNGDYPLSSTDMQFSIIDYNADGATLENFKFLSKDGITNIAIKDGFKFLNNNNGIIIAADDDATLLIKEKNVIKKFKFDKNVISASVKGDLIALCLIDNSIILFDRKTKKKYFKEYLTESLVNDIKIANPIFLDSVILYPTLDGKVVVVDIAKKSTIKTMNIDPKGNINNIIFLSAIDDALIAATPTKLFSFVNGSVNIKDLDIRNVIINEKNIIVSTLDGTILKIDKELNTLNSIKFKFAKFHALGAASYIYALEENDYLITLNADLDDVRIYDFSFDENEKAIILGDKLYFGDQSITLE